MYFANATMKSKTGDYILWLVGFALLFPLFFLLSGGVFNSVKVVIDSGGTVDTLPLPVSIAACLFGVLAFSGNYRRAVPAVTYIFLFAAALLLSLVLANANPDAIFAQQKALRALQILLPTIGFLLGHLVDDRNQIVARAFLAVISVVVPSQLLATWAQGAGTLTHYMYVFSIYSHFQYVTLILVCAFAYSFVSLWSEYKIWLCLMIIPMTLYVALSYSFLTIAAYFSFLAIVSIRKLFACCSAHRAAVILFVLATTMVGGGAYFWKLDGRNALAETAFSPFYGKFNALLQGKIPADATERFDDWKLFGKEIIESNKTLLLGRTTPMPREVRSSPHNWYLDIVHTFGLIGVVPILTLIAYTFHLGWIQRRKMSPQILWLAGIVFYLVIIDNNFKVTLRQPYPGIFAYFLWGLLLSRLRYTVAPCVSRRISGLGL